MATDDGVFAKKQQALLNSLGRLVKASQFLNSSDVQFLKASSPAVSSTLDATSDALLSALSQTNSYSSLSAVSNRCNKTNSAPSSLCEDDLTDKFDIIVDVVDNLLEKTDICLDLFKKPPKNALETRIGSAASKQQDSVSKTTHTPRTHGIIRPQLSFLDKIDNTATPFFPRITSKPNAKVPLKSDTNDKAVISSAMETHLGTLGDPHIDRPHRTYHPYQVEIESIDYPLTLFNQKLEEIYRSLDTTPLTWVDTPDLLEMMCSILNVSTEFAVDLEHHDYRSFQGFTCLIQISTRTEDFIVDSLALRSSLHLLNSSFTNPNIVKAFHGAEMDIQWLQRDFGVYVVGLFDTYHASHVLELEGHSLAFLLKYYCDVDTDKRYQLADWRVRPIPQEMMLYARTDTHYLLYIFDRMRNEMLSKSNAETQNLMRVCLQRSSLTSLNTYEKPVYLSDGLNSNGWKSLLNRFKDSLNEEGLAVFKAIHGWRDHIARKEDESLRFVMPNHMLQNICRIMPTDSTAVVACCSPTPSLVRLYAKELANLILHTIQESRQLAAAKVRMAEQIVLQSEIKNATIAKLDPTHIRFNNAGTDSDVVSIPPSAALVSESLGTASIRANPSLELYPHKVPLSKNPQSYAMPSTRSNPFVEATTVSCLFSTTTPSFGKEDTVLASAKARAAEIRSRLVLQAPAYSEVIPNPHPIESINSPSSLAVSTLGESEREIAVCHPIVEEDASLTTLGEDPIMMSTVADVVTVARPGTKLGYKKRRRHGSERANLAEGFTAFAYNSKEDPINALKVPKTTEVYSPFDHTVTKESKPIRSQLRSKSGAKSKVFGPSI
ncbi:hypothetical protein BASA50_009528 [Batrachochytrium salamandrivorans]|uniref:HRDC domain-containing protein n=1 Tax=Batrachochytrium salamandrivorans TaxID=1357716 RepID=A0ABQ8F1Q2_9FUNG|nr:hypothetical protein BASA62_003051 [Batrachochytrium salamandrivorans]KAH6590268.1 hypothetical protein BASA50_009528 [Batrachochytrium salamandrivorans]KAH9275198.1 hypothetical protein BASA83_002426 [Batrachochytrium salamandrivorans]